MGRLLVRGWREFAIVMQTRIAPDLPGWAGLVAGSLALSMTIWQTATSGNFWPLALGGWMAVMGLGLWWPLGRKGGADWGCKCQLRRGTPQIRDSEADMQADYPPPCWLNVVGIRTIKRRNKWPYG